MKDHPEARANRLGRIALGDVRLAQVEALDCLGKSGVIALPEILEVMDSPPVFNDGDATIAALVAAAGKDNGKLLHAVAGESDSTGRRFGPTLTANWLDQLDRARSAALRQIPWN